MRVITGLYKGRTIKTTDGLSIRPATDRVRQSIFNMLENRIVIEGSSVLDLFAGSGSLGIEALSRGARHAVFVETQREAAKCIEANLRTFGCESRSDVCLMDAMVFLAENREPFDLVFADPPYAFERTREIPDLLFEGGLLNPGGYLLIEHARDLKFESSSPYRVGPEKRFGRTAVTFLTGQHA